MTCHPLSRQRKARVSWISWLAVSPLAMLCVLLLSFSESALAVTKGCLSQTLDGMLGGRMGDGQVIDYSGYEKADKILFLSDGEPAPTPEYTPLALGPRIASKFPEKKIVQTDFAFVSTKEQGNLVRSHLDNTQPFPWKDNEYDRVVMRKGLCICDGCTTCAGFRPDSPEARRFFSEVARVLNKNNPDAKAVLHGMYAVDENVQAIWAELLQEIERKYGVQARFNYGYGFFHSIEMVPAPKPPLLLPPARVSVPKP